MAGSAALIVFGVVFTATQVRLDYFDSELTFRGAAHDDLVRVLESRAVQRRPALRAADGAQPQARARLALDPRRAGEPRDPARRPRRRASPSRGVALVVVSRFAVFKHAWSNDTDSPLIQSPPAGWRAWSHGDFYAAYARC